MTLVRPAVPDTQLTELLRRFHLADHATRQQLKNDIVKAALPLVRKIAYSLARRTADPVDDLIQVGQIGLLKAIDKYNPFAAASFKTYATTLITGEIRHYLRDKSSMIKAPRQIYELYYRLNLTVHQLSEHLGRTPTDVELAEALQCGVAQVNQVLEADRRRQPISLDQFALSDDGPESSYLEKLVDEHYAENVHLQETRLVLEKAFTFLKPELKDVITRTYYEDKTQTEIAQDLGISQMQVSRRLRKALAILAKALEELKHPDAGKTPRKIALNTPLHSKPPLHANTTSHSNTPVTPSTPVNQLTRSERLSQTERQP
jgi:RNA polymerase sigma-B factor